MSAFLFVRHPPISPTQTAVLLDKKPVLICLQWTLTKFVHRPHSYGVPTYPSLVQGVRGSMHADGGALLNVPNVNTVSRRWGTCLVARLYGTTYVPVGSTEMSIGDRMSDTHVAPHLYECTYDV